MAKLNIGRKIQKFIRNNTPRIDSPEPITVENANANVERFSLSSFLPYRYYDDKRKLYELDDPTGETLRVGFALQINPLMAGGQDAEAALESVITNSPPESVVMYGSLSSKGVRQTLDSFMAGRTQDNNDPLLQELARSRRDWLLTRTEESISDRQRFFLRDINYYIFVTVTYRGELHDKQELDDWILEVTEFRNSVLGNLDAASLGPNILERADFDRLMLILCNPQHDHSHLMEQSVKAEDWPHSLVMKETRTRVMPTGGIRFSNGDGDETVAVPLTVDSYPEELTLFGNHALIGNMMSGEDRISPPYWLYTIVYRPDPSKARDQAQMRLGWISKQCLSDSEWYKQMVPHLFERRNDTQRLIGETRQNHQIVRMMTGVTLFCEPSRARRDADYVSSLWAKIGYKTSREQYISLPVYLATMPFAYDSSMDMPTSGIQRATMVSSLNAATASICQGDWKGNSPWMDSKSGKIQRGGLPLVSRRGQFGLIDIFNSSTSYNFATIATSGAGKSFFVNELVLDLLSRNGIVRLFDVGRSYVKLCQRLNGQYIEFDANNPMSMNPFWGLTDDKYHPEGWDDESEEEEREDKGMFGEMIGLLKEVLAQMTHPVGNIEPYEYQLLEDALVDTHKRVYDQMGVKDVYDTLLEVDSEEAKRLALQLKPFAVGRYAAWFNGPPDLHFSNRFVVLEMEELNQDRELRAVVMLLSISAVARDIYLMDRGIKKCMLVDEAWDLLGDVRGGAMIETAYRRIRKYGGSAGIISQSLADAEISPAAKAAFANAPWKFLLKQAPSSISYARDTGIIGNDEWLLEMLGTVTATPYYSEMMVLNDAGAGLFRFPVDRGSYYIYTTNPADLGRMEAMSKAGIPDDEIIRKLAEEDYERQRKAREEAAA